VRKPKKATPEKRTQMLVVLDAGQVLLQQRPATGIWGGLLSLPEVDGHAPLDDEDPPPGLDDALAAAGRFGTVEDGEALLPLQHGFTHYRLHIHPVRVRLRGRVPAPDGYAWWDLERLNEAGMPAPVRKLLEDLGRPSLFT
jgi:A/G-specific adenine glycosylase